jgi:dynein heavy chain
LNEKLNKVARAEITKRKLGNHEDVAIKVIQLYEVINIRFGVMIVGEAGVGKTTCYRILKSSMAELIKENPENEGAYHKIEEKVINPKSVTMGELYGEIDVLTQ